MTITEIIAARETVTGWDWDDDTSAEIKQYIKHHPAGDPLTERLCELFPCEADEAYFELEADK